MPKPSPLIDPEGEVRKLSESEIGRMQPASAALPASLQTKLRTRGPQKAPTKERITIRLSPEVVQMFRATGEGWQSRMDEALKDWLKSNKPTRFV